MQRARRTAVLAVLALSGVLALTGCRSEPGVAIYVANARFSQQQVDGLASQLAQVPGIGTADSRQSIVSWIVAREVGKRLVSEQKWTSPQVDVATATGQFQQALQQDPGKSAPDMAKLAPLISLYAEFQAYIGLVQQHATPAQPTDADYADLYQRAKAAGIVEKGQDEAAYRQSLGSQNEQIFAANIGLRNMFIDEIKRADVSINPRYAPAELTLLRDSNNHALVVIPLDAKGDSAPISEG